MIGSKTNGIAPNGHRGKTPWIKQGVLASICILVVGVYACTALPGYVVSKSLSPADSYYNLLVQGFRVGQLNLKIDTPPGLRRLTDPYDPVANSSYPVLDMSYYKGKLYLYYGISPAVLLFWPYAALTGNYLPQKDAVVIFCIIGFLVSVGVLAAIWRRYFADVSVAVVAAGAMALGLVIGTPSLLARCDVWEVSISCAYAFTMLTLAGIWKALHEPQRRSWWLAAASLAYGFAVGARPSFLFGALILLVPVVQARRERQGVFASLLAATGPLALLGLGLLAYNALRFDNPLEFGWRYALFGDRRVTSQTFSLHYLWFNIRIFYLEPARWTTRFPFVRDIMLPPSPSGYGRVEHSFGILTDIPIVWLALAAPLAWRGRPAEERPALFEFVTAVAVLFGTSALTLSLFRAASIRYEVDLLPSLVLLAFVGILSLEHIFAREPRRRRAMRWGWSLLLAFSVAFSLLVSAIRGAEAHDNYGVALEEAGQVEAAMREYRLALRLDPELADAHCDLALALQKTGRPDEAVRHWQDALRLNPYLAEGHNNLAFCLMNEGHLQEAIDHYQRAVQLKPDFAGMHYNLAVALHRVGRIREAIEQYEQTLRIDPDSAEAHNNLGVCLMSQGRQQEAIIHYEQAVRLQPDNSQTHFNLGVALEQMGRRQEAIQHYEQALRMKPDNAEAQYNLGIALAQAGRTLEAIERLQQALRIKPDFPLAQNALARLQARQ
jgi:tetratricopeptide (TPR) repeat protein